MFLKVNSFIPYNTSPRAKSPAFGASAKIKYSAGSYGMLQQNLEQILIETSKLPASDQVKKATEGLKKFGAQFDFISGWQPGTTVNNYFKRLGVDKKNIVLQKIMEYITCGENRNKPLAKLLGKVQESGMLD